MKITQKQHNRIIAKEILFSILAIISVVLLAYEVLGHPSEQTVERILKVDIVIAIIFLVDYGILLYAARNKKQFVTRNWFLLLASVPIIDSWAELLRAFRLFVIVRLFRTGEHVYYAETLIQKDLKPRKISPKR